MAEGRWSSLESAVINSLRKFRDRYFQIATKNEMTEGNSDQEKITRTCYLDSLPVDIQFYVMSFLTPQDLCQLGSTSQYWSSAVRDPVLWKYFLLRDIPSWSSIDCTSLPDLATLHKPLHESTESYPDFMAEYLRCYPASRRRSRPLRPRYRAVTSFFHSLVVNSEPCFAMFGPGLEQLDVSYVRKMMTSPDVLPIAGFPQRQINGVGSGISFRFNNQQTFNIITLYSETKKERERARLEQHSVQSKLFLREADSKAERSTAKYTAMPHVQEVCRVVNGFIYVANAEENGGADREEELAQIQAMIDPAWGPSTRPLLVLSCISREGCRRIPCVNMAEQLHLKQLPNPWLVQDSEAESLNGFLNGIEWLLGEIGINV
uniref:F-box protein 4 n=1 Tax=Lepisosteus oculatus TaxID=7918 RepID=W5MN12_LEPOC|nr:PREDICTED: F-box only protein 4 isoform X1 [Lepisosteus oculatus]